VYKKCSNSLRFNTSIVRRLGDNFFLDTVYTYLVVFNRLGGVTAECRTCGQQVVGSLIPYPVTSVSCHYFLPGARFSCPAA